MAVLPLYLIAIPFRRSFAAAILQEVRSDLLKGDKKRGGLCHGEVGCATICRWQQLQTETRGARVCRSHVSASCRNAYAKKGRDYDLTAGGCRLLAAGKVALPVARVSDGCSKLVRSIEQE